MKKYLLLLSFFLISLTGFSQQSMVITYANDSLDYSYCGSISGAPYYNQFSFRVNLNGYTLADTFLIRADFGDGTYQTRTCFGPSGGGMGYLNGQLVIYSYFDHYYFTLGTYDVTYSVTDKFGVVTTLFHPAEVILSSNCSDFTVNIFVDNNSNCIYDVGDSLVNNVNYSLYNGLSYYTIKNFYFNPFPIPLGVNYTAIVDVNAIQQLGYTMTCPASGMINFTSSGNNILNFALSCNSNYDLAVRTPVNMRFKLGSSALIGVGITDISCIPQSGSYTLNLDPNLSFVNSLYAPVSGSGSTFNWNFSNLSTIGLGQGGAHNMMYVNLDPSVQLGDILCYTFSVSPTLGDIDPSNNTSTICGPVVSAFDPNFKDVSPKGVGANGSILPNTKLTYTIGYQNTGNDTARNVYVMDTLSSNVDVNTLRVLYTTYPMHLYIIDGHILKFDFPDIYLPDSGVNEMASHGFFAYEIDQNPNLINGTVIQNTAGIYFDANAPVITNTTLNTINTALGVESIAVIHPEIYPNPFADYFQIDFEKQFNGSIVINDFTGRKIQSQSVNGKSFKINSSNLIPGIYLLEIRNASGELIQTKKLLKE